MKKLCLLKSIVLLVCININCFSQIDLTVLDPEDILELPDSAGINYYHLDLDDDGTDDFKLKVKLFTTQEFAHTEVRSYKSAISGLSSNLINIGPFDDGDSITSSLQFWPDDEFYCLIPEFGGILGSWAHLLSSTDDQAYIGLKLINNNEEYYGWLKLKTDGKSITISSYAVNTMPNQFILAGQEN